MTKLLFIGDVHFKHSNATETRVLMEKIQTLDYDVAVVAGDVLDTHEKVDIQLLNRAYDMIRTLRDKTLTYVLVGNHDYINNQQFLTDAHWMNAMKEWANVVIVDRPTRWTDTVGNVFVFVPYVFPGRFLEALSTIVWSDATCIFAHQEFKGCKMGAFESTNGDDWDTTWPLVISGHVHERQRHQPNVLYPGSVLTHAFGASEQNQGLSIFEFDYGKKMSELQIQLDIKAKRTLYVKIGNPIKSRDLIPSNRFCVSGSAADVASFKKSVQYSLMKEARVKVVFIICASELEDGGQDHMEASSLFETILVKLIRKENDKLLDEDYAYCCM